MGRMLVNENKLTPIAREYVSQYKDVKVEVRTLLIHFSTMLIYVLMSVLIWFNIQPNIIDNLICLVFALSVIGTTTLIAFVIVAFVSMGILKNYPQTKLEALKKSDFSNQSLINRLVNFPAFVASLIYVALLTTTDHSFIFVFSCIFMILNHVSIRFLKSLFTGELNELTEEDFETLNSMPEPEKSIYNEETK